MPVLTVREEIANAIVEGLSEPGQPVPEIQEHSHDGKEIESRVFARGHAEPIIVKADDVILPEWAEPLRAGIQLDVQAILASQDH